MIEITPTTKLVKDNKTNTYYRKIVVLETLLSFPLSRPHLSSVAAPSVQYVAKFDQVRVLEKK